MQKKKTTTNQKQKKPSEHFFVFSKTENTSTLYKVPSLHLKVDRNPYSIMLYLCCIDLYMKVFF